MYFDTRHCIHVSAVHVAHIGARCMCNRVTYYENVLAELGLVGVRLLLRICACVCVCVCV